MAGTIKRGPFTGHLQVKGDRGARRWHAFVSGPTGKRQRILGPAHVKNSGRTTARGATIWRAADGSRPTPEHLTPADAETRLDALMDGLARTHTVVPTEPALVERTFGEARLEWLRYVTKDRKRERSTVTDYENTSARDLLPEFGANTPLSEITTDRIDAWRERLTEEEKLSPRSIQKAMVLLNGIFRRAKRKGWVTTKKPCSGGQHSAPAPAGALTLLYDPGTEQVAQRPLMALAEPRDRRVIRRLVSGAHAPRLPAGSSVAARRRR